MTVDVSKAFAKTFHQLESVGLLLVSGTEIPDVRRLVSGRVSIGSWWQDADADSIFAINEMLEEHPDVLTTKLIAGKVTFVHRPLWRKLFAIAAAREEWQLRNLTPEGRKLLRKLDQEQRLETNTLSSADGRKPGETARELELRLLIHSEQIHTKTGAHAKILQTWQCWAESVGLKPRPVSVAAARTFFERRLSAINPRSSGLLPWNKRRR